VIVQIVTHPDTNHVKICFGRCRKLWIVMGVCVYVCEEKEKRFYRTYVKRYLFRYILVLAKVILMSREVEKRGSVSFVILD
jgi:hypothetical protein